VSSLPEASLASRIMAALAGFSVLTAWAAGFGSCSAALSDPAPGSATTGGWLLGGGVVALAFDVLAIVLGAIGLALRRGTRSPGTLLLGIASVTLGVVGLVGVALLLAGGLALVAPGVH